MTPLYLPDLCDPDGDTCEVIDSDTPWLREAETRSECFMSPLAPLSYTYGTGRGVRTYTSVPMTPIVTALMPYVNLKLAEHDMGPVNVCFLNKYEGERQHLGWHSDNHPGTDHTRPIVSVSFGHPREIWWRATPCEHCGGSGLLVAANEADTKGQGSTFAKRTPEQIASYQPGTVLSYYGQGDVYFATKQGDDTWHVEGIWGDIAKFLPGTITAMESLLCPTCKGSKAHLDIHRQLLGSGSMFVMPPGMQQGWQHRIPKGDRRMGTRISLTFRAFL